MIRFRHRPGREPRQVHGNTRLEVAWTIVPAVLLAGVAVPTVATIFDLAGEPPSNALEVTVTGHQWWWEVEYQDEEVVTANEVQVQTADVAASPPTEIEQVVTGTCMSCHQIRGLEAATEPVQPAPDLTRVG